MSNEPYIATAALAVAITALLALVVQWYWDHLALFPYRIRYRGRLRSNTAFPGRAQSYSFSIYNRTSQVAWFQVGHPNEVTGGLSLADHVFAFPTNDREKSRLFVSIPAKTSMVVNARIFPFGSDEPAKWTLVLREWNHLNSPRLYKAPSDLSKECSQMDTDLPDPRVK